MDFVENTKNVMQSLTSSDPMQQHSVYNHTLLSPHQVSISKAMSLHQCSGLVGGSPSAGSRVIDSFPEDSAMLWGKDDLHKMAFSKEESYLTDVFSNAKTMNSIHSTCTSTLQTKDSINGTAQENGCNVDDDDEDDDDDDDDDSGPDDDSDSSDDGGNDSDVENFIQVHLARKKEFVTRRNGGEQAVFPKTAPKANVTVQTMEGFLQKTDELIKHNLLLQQQISALKRETSLQTKVLTKLLVKRSKKHNKKPYDENSASL